MYPQGSIKLRPITTLFWSGKLSGADNKFGSNTSWHLPTRNHCAIWSSDQEIDLPFLSTCFELQGYSCKTYTRAFQSMRFFCACRRQNTTTSISGFFWLNTFCKKLTYSYSNVWKWKMCKEHSGSVENNQYHSHLSSGGVRTNYSLI